MAAAKLQEKDCPRPSVPEEGCAASGGWQATGSLGLMQGSADQPLPIQEDCWLDGVWCPDLGPLEDACSIEYERNMKGLPISY